MKYKNHNSKANARFIGSVCKWGSLAILALFAVTAIPAMAHNPGLVLACGMILPVAKCHKFLDFDGRTGGGVMSPEVFQQKVLGGVEALQTKAKNSEEHMKRLEDELIELRGQNQSFRKAALSSVVKGDSSSNGGVSHDCARMLGAIGMAKAIQRGHVTDNRDAISRVVVDVLGKTALTTSDIPLPVSYSGEVVELVAQYGAARKFGTVFPLPSGVVKLPRLKTDTAFGLIAMSAAISQKSPQFEFVTFNAEKWGGMIVIPTEISEDGGVALGQFIARYAARQIARIEDTVFFAADGTGTYDSLEGLTTSVVTDSKVVELASTKTKYSDVTMAKFRELRSIVDSPVLGSGKYYLHPTFEQVLASFNTAGDKPYLANGIKGASFDGFGIEWVDVLPAYSASTNAAKVFALFGDLSYQYLGVRGPIRFDMSDIPGFANDQLYVRSLERFTIGKMAAGAVGGLKTAAS